MLDHIRARRRWILFGTAVLLLMLGAPWAWRYRPMSARERALLGTWRLSSMSPSLCDEFTFTRDRCFTARSVKSGWEVTGTWRGSANEVLMFTPYPPLPIGWAVAEVYVRRFLDGQLEGETAGSFPYPDTSSRMSFRADDGSVISCERVP